MNEQSGVEPVGQVKSRWHKLLVFPLVAMLAAIATFLIATVITSFVMNPANAARRPALADWRGADDRTAPAWL